MMELRDDHGFGATRMLGTRYDTTVKSRTRFDDERYCEEPNCGNRLSVYNPGPHCYRHEQAHKPRIGVRGRKFDLTVIE